jgi:hypothetical protein
MATEDRQDDTTPKFQEPPALPDKPTVKLAVVLEDDKPVMKGNQPVRRRPITFADSDEQDAPVNMGEGLTVFVPTVEHQASGFTPYSLEKFDGDPQPDRTWKVNRTREFLDQFRGTYIPIKDK